MCSRHERPRWCTERKPSGRHNQIDPGVRGIVLGHDHPLRIPVSSIYLGLDVEDGRVTEVQPQWVVTQIPAAEVAVWERKVVFYGVLCAADLEGASLLC